MKMLSTTKEVCDNLSITKINKRKELEKCSI